MSQRNIAISNGLGTHSIKGGAHLIKARANIGYIKELLFNDGMHEMLAAEAYKTGVKPPVGTSYSLIEDMDGLVVRDWTAGGPQGLQWADLWCRVTGDHGVSPMSTICHGFADHIEVPLSLKHFPISFEGSDIKDVLEISDIYCNPLPLRRPFATTDIVTATVIETSLSGDEDTGPCKQWFAVLGGNHLPLILQHSAAATIIEPKEIREWREWRMRCIPNQKFTLRPVMVYGDARTAPHSCRTALKRIINNGWGNVVSMNLSDVLETVVNMIQGTQNGIAQLKNSALRARLTMSQDR